MSLISLLVVVLVLALVLYVIQLLPIEGTAKQILYIVLVIIVALWLLQAFVGLESPVWRRGP